MEELYIYLKCGRQIRSPSVTPDQFNELIEFMNDDAHSSITMVKNIWIKKEEIILITLGIPELYKNSPPLQ
jgi:hypothetical protein